MDSAAHRIRRSRAAATAAVARSGRPAAHVRAPTSAVTQKQELMRRLRRTKILATLGPASSDRNVIAEDRKSTRLNSSHLGISYAVFCLKKKKSPNKHEPFHTNSFSPIPRYILPIRTL